MAQPATHETAPLKSAEKVFIAGLIVWILAQLIRFIAIPLITSVSNGLDAAGWMYPAVLDVVTAVFAIPLAVAIWKGRGFTVWALTLVYFTLSIVDHIGALTNLTIIGAPVAFAEMNQGANPYTAPIIQTLLDVVFFCLLFVPKFRNLFFKLR
jgi:hypothetical protein